MTGMNIGFVGLGDMGGPMAKNIAKSSTLVVYDKAGTSSRAPEGATALEDLADVARNAETIFLSVPDGAVSISIIEELSAQEDRITRCVVDLSTTGMDASREAWEIADAAGIIYIDAPVSGGQAGARAGTVSLMWAGPETEMTRHQDVLKSFTGNVFHVGDKAGQGQALKVLNNFLSGTALVATSEAVLFGMSQGLDMKVMLDVINVSTGQNTASRDKFPARIMTETYDAGFKTALEAKDVRLYMDALTRAGTPGRVSKLVSDIWNECDEALPGSDFTRIFEYIRDSEE
ncbi:MAG: NAD(P)-dependent oxidoreductase [Alphaproteobacteria bacterium]|nr:NAD(P)-dependent oxidoreductase [Alphaproteobacteria bacterium]MBT4085705.1 NAD(P)-dependent oxidoreductase [Alphaproteobacteria bacterium]MBT4543284.1 NAD(P)-dependent oxidoreductase [Alphaproteobacteria bacterium]MBT7747227.1 NAD(P)-dependent oxidoreductase [Alphaproteobacteria bacterium]